MTAIDRYTLIEAAANGVPLWGTDSDADGYTFSYERGAEEIIADTLPVIARELLAPLRESLSVTVAPSPHRTLALVYSALRVRHVSLRARLKVVFG